MGFCMKYETTLVELNYNLEGASRRSSPIGLPVGFLQYKLKSQTGLNKSDMLVEFYAQDVFSILSLSQNPPERSHLTKYLIPD